MIKCEAKEQIKTRLANSCYKENEFELYVAEAGWEDWMEDFVESDEPTERELERIKDIQREAWDEYWENK